MHQGVDNVPVAQPRSSEVNYSCTLFPPFFKAKRVTSASAVAASPPPSLRLIKISDALLWSNRNCI